MDEKDNKVNVEQAIADKMEIIKLCEESIKGYEGQVAALEKQLDIVTKYPKRIIPVFEYEQHQEYWDSENELRNIDVTSKLNSLKREIDNALKVKNLREQEIKRLKGEVDE